MIKPVFAFALLLFFTTPLLVLPASKNGDGSLFTYKLVHGVRVIENQVISETVTLDGEVWDGAIIRNNIFRNQTDKGLHISNVHNLTIENNEFYGMKDNAIKLRSTQRRGTDHVLIKKNYFHDIPMTPILTGEPNTNTQIIGNKFFDVATNVNASTDQHGMYLKGPDFLVEGNIMARVQGGNGISIRSSGVVRGNVVKHVAQTGIKYYSNSEKRGRGLLLIENNIVIANKESGIAFGRGNQILIDHAIIRFNWIIDHQKGVIVGRGLESIDFRFYGNMVINTIFFIYY